MSTEQGNDAAAGDVSQPPAEGAGDQRTIGDILNEESTMQYVKYNAGVFVAIGVGFALALVLMDALVSSGNSMGGGSTQSGGIAAGGIVIAFFLSPLIAAITGTVTSLRLEDTEKAVATAASAGAFAGHVSLLLLVIVTAGIVTDGGSGGFTDELLALLGFGVGVAAAGGITAVVTERFA